METIFITRTKSKEDFKPPELEKIIKLIQAVWNSGIKKIYILSNFKKDNYKLTSSITVKVVKDNKPVSSISINRVLRKIKRAKDIDKKRLTFLVSSKEVVGLTKEKIKKIVKEMQNNIEADNDLLVLGYTFKIKDNERLDCELQDYYANKNLIAYKVPWNTCAIWNYELFDDYVTKFDEITNENSFTKVCVCVDNVCYETEHEGMEDGLAIAKAASRKKKPKILFKLLDDHLDWNISSDKEVILKHRKKLARKDTVLRNFMAIRNYSEGSLLKAENK